MPCSVRTTGRKTRPPRLRRCRSPFPVECKKLFQPAGVEIAVHPRCLKSTSSEVDNFFVMEVQISARSAESRQETKRYTAWQTTIASSHSLSTRTASGHRSDAALMTSIDNRRKTTVRRKCIQGPSHRKSKCVKSVVTLGAPNFAEGSPIP